MSWSTREIADIAGTTVKAVRHYHEIGLLEEPERSSNGYKKYTTVHLLRILRIRRLSELGIPLAQMTDRGTAPEEPADAIRIIDAELAQTIARLQRIRAELAVLARHGVPLDVPAEFASVADQLSDKDKELVTIYSHLFDSKATEAFRDAVQERTADDDAFDALPADATDAEIEDLARRLVPAARRARARSPLAGGLPASPRYGGRDAPVVLGQALVELYNPAQIRTMVLLDQLAGQFSDAPAGPDPHAGGSGPVPATSQEPS